MKLIDKLFDINPELAKPDNPDYRMYEKGLAWTAVGLLAVTGASAGDVVGLHDPAKFVVGTVGSMEMWSGVIMIALGCDKVSKRTSD
jgi:hypothetical protein